MLRATCCNHVYVYYSDVGVAHPALVLALTEKFRRVVSVKKISTFCAEILILASFSGVWYWVPNKSLSVREVRTADFSADLLF